MDVESIVHIHNQIEKFRRAPLSLNLHAFPVHLDHRFTIHNFQIEAAVINYTSLVFRQSLAAALK